MDEQLKRRLFLAILGGLAAALLIVGAVVLSLDRVPEPAETSEPESSFAVPENELLIDDLYEGKKLIPKFSRKASAYRPEKFKETNGFLRYDDPNARLGVDVSEYQGDVDWEQVREAGIDFAILRVGYRGMTQGLLNADAAFERNFTGATDAGLFVGVYFFSQAVTEAEARAEADFVLELLDGRKLAYPIAFDWERTDLDGGQLEPQEYRVYGVDGKTASACAAAFCERVEEAGYTACVYTNKHLAYEFFDLDQWADYDLWFAEYQPAPSLYYDFRLWQYTNSGSVPGIEGGVDMNICFKPY